MRLIDNRYVYLCLHQDSFTINTGYKYAIYIYSQTIKDGVTVDGVKAAGEFIATNIIRPIVEGLATVFRSILTAMFLTLGETSSGYQTTKTATGFIFKSFIDNKEVSVSVTVDSSNQLMFTVGIKSFTIDLFKLILNSIIPFETLSPESAINGIITATVFENIFTNIAFVAMDKSKEAGAGSMGIGAAVALTISLMSMLYGSATFLGNFLARWHNRNKFSGEELKQYDHLFKSWISLYKVTLTLSITLYYLGRNLYKLRNIMKQEGQTLTSSISKVLKENFEIQGYTSPAIASGLFFVALSTIVMDFTEVILLQPTMTMWIAFLIVLASEITTYGLLDLGKTPLYNLKIFISAIVFPNTLYRLELLILDNFV